MTLVKVKWVVGGNPAGLTATYLADHVADLADSAAWDVTPGNTISPVVPGPSPLPEITADALLRPIRLFIELQPPPPAVARSLRLDPGTPEAIIVVLFEDPVRNQPAH